MLPVLVRASAASQFVIMRGIHAPTGKVPCRKSQNLGSEYLGRHLQVSVRRRPFLSRQADANSQFLFSLLIDCRLSVLPRLDQSKFGKQPSILRDGLAYSRNLTNHIILAYDQGGGETCDSLPVIIFSRVSSEFVPFSNTAVTSCRIVREFRQLDHTFEHC